MTDYHIHSDISGDCAAPMARMADAARKAGLKEICFTEHIDINFPGGTSFVPDFEVYDAKFALVKSAFPDIDIKKGVEAGLEIRTNEKLLMALAGKNFDFIIGSVHLVRGHDPYCSDFWSTFPGRSAFEEYLKECLLCAKEFDLYDVFGHLGYPSKFCPRQDSIMRYGDYADAVDGILRTLVQKGKGLEVNTSGIRNTGTTIPEPEIIKRFLEIGGEIITVGSDAHDEQSVGRAVPETLEMLKNMGLKYICAFDERRPRFINIT